MCVSIDRLQQHHPGIPAIVVLCVFAAGIVVGPQAAAHARRVKRELDALVHRPMAAATRKKVLKLEAKFETLVKQVRFYWM